jgi:hypothetical protein
MSFYGVAHDRLPRVVADSETAVRATVSTSFVPAEADRQIGVWCVAPVFPAANYGHQTGAISVDNLPNCFK